MQQQDLQLVVRPERRNWLRLRTLIILRWTAIAGQLLTISYSSFALQIDLPLGPCSMVVGAAIIANLVAIYVFPQNKRLAEREALPTLLFDLLQLSALLYLTGGLTNPFALLVLAPVTVSASALTLRSTLILGAASILLITLVAVFNVPLVQADGTILRQARLLEFGFWLSIVIGIGFIGLFARRIATEIRSMSDALLATQMALAREQKLTDLGGVVAAAAHELGTPLATIKLVSSELIDELAARPELQADARLIRDQADRCRDILQGMGKAGKSDLYMRQAPLEALLREAAEPHAARGRNLVFRLRAGSGGAPREPVVYRLPELIHGLRNLVQNAVDFAHTTVWIEAEWTAGRIVIRITDDGEGFPPDVIGRIGDPFVRSRRFEPESPRRPGYEGMGLGLFIAKTLLERTGAELSFANAADQDRQGSTGAGRRGAIVVVAWAMGSILAPEAGRLGQNKRFA